MSVKNKISIFISLLTLLGINNSLVAQKSQPMTRILFIYDASNSMNGTWESGKKHTIAQKLLTSAIDSITNVENLEIALRVYGHQKYYKNGQDCEDTRLEVPFAANNHDKIRAKLKQIEPKGTTLIAYSLEQAANDFPECSDCRNIIILITDGIEECNGDPCAISLALQSKGIILKPFVIGVGLDVQFAKTFECIGNYYDAANETTFKNVLNIVISQAMNSTSVQVNLLDKNGQPNETNVNMTFYDHYTKTIHNNFVHTINHRGNPDTIPLDPSPTYDMVVHTIPSVQKDSIVLTPGIHNIIAVDAPQGQLELKVSGRSVQHNTLKAIIRQKDDCRTLHVQDFKAPEKYLVGKYDLEILTLPRTYINDVEISQSHTTTIEIPNYGIVTLLANGPGNGSIYLEENGRLKWIHNFNHGMTRESLNLQPGNYRVVFRPKSAKQSVFTIEEPFTIKSGSSTTVKLF